MSAPAVFRLPTLRAGARGRILSGMRPTGRLHLGNWVGALRNWVELQDAWENFHMVADWHALTTATDRTEEIQSNTYEMVLDWLAAGIDPAKSPMFVQSHVKEHAELHLLFSMLISKARLKRNPTLKDQVKDLGMEEATISYGHLGYACLQAADILLYRANAVPVGEDQVPHIEITREIARRFNHLYAPDDPVFPEPEPLLTAFPRLRGLDGGRMSKSVGNTILLSDTPEDIFARVRTAYTDPTKIRKNDPGHPEGCVVWEYHRLFNPGGFEEIGRLCRAGELGCVDDKKHLTQIMVDALAPIRSRREELAREPDYVWDVLREGARRAREEAVATMERVRSAMHLVDPKGRRGVLTMAGYEVKLERFEGPLDLLLHLIQRDEIDIYDIPIARITQQYLTYIELMRLLDLDVAGEFLVMAATLMRIKAKMLLPTPPPGEEEEIDPRDELVQRLLEYRQFKEASSTLKTREEHRRLEYERGMVPGDEEAGPLPLAPATLFHLLDALNRVLARLPARTVLELEGEAYDIEEKIERIHNRVRVAGKLSFETLLGECRSRLEMIVTFLALLELLKLNRLSAIQDGNFGEIVLAPPVSSDAPSEWEEEPHGN